MIIFLSGADTFRSRQHLKKMIQKFKADRDPQGLNVVKMDAEREKEPGKILEQILAAPFLAERRMVIVENLLSSKHKELMVDILNRIKSDSLPQSNVIIFWEGTDKFKTKDAKALADILDKQKFSQKFERLKGAALGVWILEEVKNSGGDISKPALQYIVHNLGSDMWGLDSLIKQLVSYRNKDTIEADDVMLFLDEKADDNIFNLVDALCAKQSREVYKMVQEQYRIGEDVQFIFAMILRQFTILIQIRDLFDREDILQSGALASRLGLHPFVVKKSLPLVKKYTLKELAAIYEKLLDLDVGIKTGREKPEILLDIFVGKTCLAK